MNKVTIFNTSKQVIDNNTDMYPNIISNSIESELRRVDSDAEVSCITQIQNSMAFIAGEVIADSSIDASAIIRNKINRLFQKDSLYPSTKRNNDTITTHLRKESKRLMAFLS